MASDRLCRTGAADGRGGGDDAAGDDDVGGDDDDGDGAVDNGGNVTAAVEPIRLAVGPVGCSKKQKPQCTARRRR